MIWEVSKVDGYSVSEGLLFGVGKGYHVSLNFCVHVGCQISDFSGAGSTLSLLMAEPELAKCKQSSKADYKRDRG